MTFSEFLMMLVAIVWAIFIAVYLLVIVPAC